MLGSDLCARGGCNHPRSWHRLDDSTTISPTDPNAEFRCIGYDVATPSSPLRFCTVACKDFLEPVAK